MNKVILLGRLTKDPEIRFTTTSSTAIANFTLAVNRKFAKQGDEQQADFIPVVAWGKTAEFCEKYFKKGQQVSIVGRIQVRKWVDKEGGNRYSTEVVAEEVYFADSKRTGDSPAPAHEDVFAPPNQYQDLTEGSDGFKPTDNDDELPF